MRSDEIRSLLHFDEASPKYASLYERRDAPAHSFRARLRKTHALLGDGPLGKLLDVGGGPAVYFDRFKKQVESYDLVDISPGMIEMAQKIDSGNVPLRCHLGSVYCLPFPPDSFDTVLAAGLLEYLDDPWRGLEELARVARSDARIVVSFPNARGVGRRVSKIVYRFFGRSNPFGREFTAAEVAEAAARIGVDWIASNSYNAQLVPWPLTWRMPGVAYVSAELFEPLLTWSDRAWGSGFNVQFRKAARACTSSPQVHFAVN
jgi:ubiquinone/menaquinone biosynthesis C-methylase UbiE